MALTKISSNEIQPAAITSDLISADVSLGVKISNVSIANSSYTILDDTAVDTAGGYIVITGAGFNSGAQVIIGGTNATSVTRVSSTELRAQVPAKSAATYNVYVVNTDGSTGIRVNGLTYSSLPTWVTGSTLTNWRVDVAANVTFDATGVVSYANTTELPSGTTLLSNGYFYGTITGIESETTYSFTVRATDAQNQDSDRTFDLTTIVETAPSTVEYLVVAGGGGGGARHAGGGGAGGYRTGPLSVSSGVQYTVTVGSGGAGGAVFPGGGYSGFKGADSVFSTITSSGGGWGSGDTPNPGQSSPASGGSGGSGGGGQNNGTPGSGNTPATTPSQGNSGGTPVLAGGAGAGGGGYGSAGGGKPSNETAGGGGSGGTSSISGTTMTYAGGGGGGTRNQGPAGAGQDGGGNGSATSNGQAGEANRGGGGGGGAQDYSGGNGGSGIVIIRYPDTNADAVSTTGSPTYTNTGGYKIYKFTGSGSITW